MTNVLKYREGVCTSKLMMNRRSLICAEKPMLYMSLGAVARSVILGFFCAV